MRVGVAGGDRHVERRVRVAVVTRDGEVERPAAADRVLAHGQRAELVVDEDVTVWLEPTGTTRSRGVGSTR